MDDTIGLPVSAIFYTIMSIMVMVMVVAVTQMLLFYGYVDNKEQELIYNSYDQTLVANSCDGTMEGANTNKSCELVDPNLDDDIDMHSYDSYYWDASFQPFPDNEKLNAIFGTITVEKTTSKLVQG